MNVASHQPEEFVYDALGDRLKQLDRNFASEAAGLVKFQDYDLALISDDAIKKAGLLNLRGGSAQEMRELLVLAADTVDSLFRLAAFPAGQATVPVSLLGLQGVPQVSTGPTSRTTVARWMDGFSCALATDQSDVVNPLSDVPLDLIRRSSTTFPECAYLLVAATQQLWHQSPELPETVRRGLELTGHAHLRPDEYSYVDDLIVPVYDMISALALGEEEHVNTALVGVLRGHGRYYHRQEDHRLNDPRGFLGLSALGWGRYAVRAGYDLHVTSGYMPADLLR
ncbi:immunity 49 family protein [Deinococcus sp. Leaf326]|uniref:immunity 49 family protein n=1 Tax=Deinococcus sp. Leaf326 TaxID=1736338 RepID=UPI000700F519|nr:immunity 49 family protein [Deinococcus sp. Leaf326]KQR04658.1 hypothetical protein ASF71_11575 [Deinococcus sp. Leaf326]